MGFIRQYLAAFMYNLNLFYTLLIWQSGVNFLGLMPWGLGCLELETVNSSTLCCRICFKPTLLLTRPNHSRHCGHRGN
jgi:hypothetical protein